MYEISVESHFSAAHHLNNYKGSCENLHGHNWLVRVFVECETLDTAGLGIDFRVLKGHVKEIMNELDHKDLNTVFDPLKINPSSENIARYIYEKLEQALGGWNGSMKKVEVHETPGCVAAYFK
jgi:6-pyruvoyltetrahydropterin/6-carboxytetrahydropterin synthase